MQSKYKKVISNSIVFAIGSLGSKFVNFFLLPLYTYTLTKSEYGATDIIQTSVNLMVPVISLSVFDAVLRFAMDKSVDRSQVLTVGVVGTCFGSIVATVIGIILVLCGVKYAIFLLFMVITQIIQSLFSQYIKAIGKVQIFAFNGIFLTFLTAILSFILLYLIHFGISGYFYSIISATLISNIYLFFREKLYKDISFKNFNKSLLREMLIYSIPLIPNTIAWWATNAINRYFILFFIGTSANGLFAVANKIPSLLSTVNTVFFQSWQISAIEEFDSKNSSKFYSNIFNAYFQLMFLGTACILSILKPLMHMLVSESFYGAWKYVPFLLLTVMYSSFSSFFDQYYVASKKTIGVLLTTIIGSIINITLNFIFIPMLGVEGAGISSAISFLSIWLIRIFDTRKFLITKFNLKNILFNHLFIFIQILVLFLNDSSVGYIVNAIIIIFCAVLNRDIVLGTFKIIVTKLQKKK